MILTHDGKFSMKLPASSAGKIILAIIAYDPKHDTLHIYPENTQQSALEVYAILDKFLPELKNNIK